MLCREYQEFFSDLYDGDLASERRADLQAHLATCSPCQDEYKIFKESLAALQGLGEVPAGDRFAARVRYAISQDKERGMLYAETGLAKPSTRRVMSPPPARKPWALAFASVAAAAAVALAVLYVGQRDALQIQTGELSAKKREVEKLEAQIRNAPKVEIPNNVVIVDGKKIQIDEFIRQKMADQGLVATGSTWISKEIKERLDKGEVNIDGVWTPMAEIVQQGIDDWRKKNPEVTRQGLTEEEVLASKGLVPHGKWFVPKEWADALNSDQVIGRSGEARDRRDIIAAAMKENHLVDHEGRWMTDEQRTELLAQRRVQKSDLITQDSAVSRVLDNLEIGAPLGYKNLTLYPLISKKQKDIAFTTLTEAIAVDKVELIDDIHALQVHIKNKGATDLVVLAGEVLAGGNYGRVVAKDAIIAPQSTASVDVFDAEPTVTRALTAPRFAKESGHHWAPLGVRRALVAEQGQGAVWSLLQTMMAGKVSTPKDLYAVHRSPLTEYRTALYAFHEDAGVVGLAVAVGENVVAAELFANHANFVSQFDRVLNSAAIEAILISQAVKIPSSLPTGAGSVKRMLENVFSAEHETSEGSIVLKRGGVPFGRAVLKGEDALRVTIFADGPLEARNAADVPDKKFNAILAAFNERLKSSTPGRRQALYREMAMLPSRIAKPLGDHLKNSRKETATFDAVASTLSKLGGEDAAMALIRELDPDTLECAKIAADYIPAAMRTLRERVPLEKAVTALISNMEHITSKASSEDLQKTADASGFPFTVQTLRTAMRLDGQKVADYSAWWKDPVHRDEFYARMLK